MVTAPVPVPAATAAAVTTGIGEAATGEMVVTESAPGGAGDAGGEGAVGQKQVGGAAGDEPAAKKHKGGSKGQKEERGPKARGKAEPVRRDGGGWKHRRFWGWQHPRKPRLFAGGWQ